jgi:diaminopimelate epimerase
MTRYTKLNSQGNDFILIESNKHLDNFTIDDIKHYSRRDVVGCDQFFIVDASDRSNVFCDVYNQDGSKACQCGNGLRATMLFLNEKYSITKTNLIVCDVAYRAKINNKDISVDMGQASYINIKDEYTNPKYNIKQSGIVVTIENISARMSFSFIPLSIGNKHCIVFSDYCIKHKDEISSVIDEIFNKEMNVGFISNAQDFIIDGKAPIDLVVNERGAGYTESCGSGATAAAICMFKLYELEHECKVNASSISVRQKGGVLSVIKSYNPDRYELVGPSAIEGEGNLE